MPEGRTKDKLLILIIFLLLGGLIGIVARECSQPKKKPNPTLVETIKVLRDTVYKYEPAKYSEPIRILTTRYRTRIDSVRIWVHEGSTWDSVCKITGIGSDSGMDCKRLLLRDHIRAQYQDTLLAIYRAQRYEDSTQIGMMFKLDSMASELIKQKDGEITQAKRESRRKVAKNAFMGGLLGFIVGVVL